MKQSVLKRLRNSLLFVLSKMKLIQLLTTNAIFVPNLLNLFLYLSIAFHFMVQWKPWKAKIINKSFLRTFSIPYRAISKRSEVIRDVIGRQWKFLSATEDDETCHSFYTAATLLLW